MPFGPLAAGVGAVGLGAGLYSALGGGGGAEGQPANLIDWLRPFASGFGPGYSGSNNIQLPYVDQNQMNASGYPKLGLDQVVGPSGYGGFLPNLAYLYGQGPGDLAAPREVGLNDRMAGGFLGFDQAMQNINPMNQMGQQSLHQMLSGAPLRGQGTLDYFANFGAPTYARGNDPMYTAGLAALGGAGRMLPSMLDPRTEGARRQALSGTVPTGTYAPLIDDIERRGAERQTDLTQAFNEEAVPGLVQRLATGQSNYGSAGERLSADLTQRYGEQQRRIESDTTGSVSALHAQAAREAQDRQQQAMMQGVQSAQGIFGQGANLLGGQSAMEQGVMQQQLDRALQAGQLNIGNILQQSQLGLGALPSVTGNMLNPYQQYLGMGMMERDIGNAMLAERARVHPLALQWANLNRLGAGTNQVPTGAFVQPGAYRENDGFSMAGLGAMFSGAGSLYGAFGGGGGAPFGATNYGGP